MPAAVPAFAVLDQPANRVGGHGESPMTQQEREMIERWVRTWEEAGPRLEELRREEIRNADNLHVLALLEPAFNHALRAMPPRQSSGMVEMQAYFAKLRS